MAAASRHSPARSPSAQRDGHAGGGGGSGGTDSIWKACAYGDYEQLRQYVERRPELVNQPDDQGYYALQWAALNNRVPCCTYLLEHGAEVNAADSTQQTALHWAGVRGSLSVAETLLRAGASLEAQDCRGYTVCHVAAQYGQTAFIYHVALRWDADVDVADVDGRTPLHWAAYKGFADTIRLLLVMDARWSLPDREGCTPLHWAAIRGNAEACTLLLQAGSDVLLLAQDATGSTPSQLAVEKGHRYLGLNLADYRSARRQEHEAGGKAGACARACGKGSAFAWLTHTQLCPVIWAIVLGLVAAFVLKVVWNPRLAPPPGAMRAAACLCVAAATGGLWLLYRVTSADPGFLPRGQLADEPGAKRAAVKQPSGSGEAYNQYRYLDVPALWVGNWSQPCMTCCNSDSSYDANKYLASKSRQLDSPALWAGNWSQLCVSCKIVRPLRAKHCGVTDHCVANFDHFCPWVGNVVGKGNRHLFLAFLWVETFAMSVALACACVRLHQIYSSEHPTAAGFGGPGILIAFVVADGFMLVSVLALAITQASQVARNVTTNELANWSRYRYMKDASGDFHNPFDRGCRQNCADTMWPESVAAAPMVMHEDQAETMSLLKMEQGQLSNNEAQKQEAK